MLLSTLQPYTCAECQTKLYFCHKRTLDTHHTHTSQEVLNSLPYPHPTLKSHDHGANVQGAKMHRAKEVYPHGLSATMFGRSEVVRGNAHVQFFCDSLSVSLLEACVHTHTDTSTHTHTRTFIL